MEQLPVSTIMPFPPEFPAVVAAFGFKSTPGGAHNSRTMMLAEIRRLIESSPSDATLDDYREAVIEMNVLGKATATTRRKTFKLLHELYALSSAIPLFAMFRDLMRYDLEAAPLLSLLAAWSRDPLLRATTSVVLGADFGMEVRLQDVRNAVENAFPDRYSQASLGTATRNAASTWTQSEQLAGNNVLRWENGIGSLYKFGRENIASLHNVDRRGEGAWGKKGVAVSQMRNLPACILQRTKV